MSNVAFLTLIVTKMPGARSAQRWVPRFVAFALAVAAGLGSSRPAMAQPAESFPELETHRIHGLRLEAPSPLQQPPEAQAALAEAVDRSPGISEAQMYIWNQGILAVSLAHYGIVSGGDYDLDRGLRGALARGTKRMGGQPQSGPDAYSVRETDVSGLPALVGSNRVQFRDGTARIRVLATRAGRDVWIVTLLGRDGPEFRKLSDAVLRSLAVEVEGS